MRETWKRARELRHTTTDAERFLWRHLRRENFAAYKFRRQYPIAGYIADFACVSAKLVVELDGGQHADALEYDERRTRKIAACSYRVLRFWNDDVFLRTEDVLEEIWQGLHRR
jgi:very-short-patch-repair endonuclease